MYRFLFIVFTFINLRTSGLNEEIPSIVF